MGRNSFKNTKQDSSEFTICVTADKNPVSIGEELSYEISIINCGPQCVKNLVLCADIELLNPIVSMNGEQSQWSEPFSLPDLPACSGENTLSLTISGTVGEESGGGISASFRVFSKSGDHCLKKNSQTEWVKVIPGYPVLQAVKEANVTSLSPGDTFSYILTIENIGRRGTENPLKIIDPLPKNVTLNGVPTSNFGAVKNTGNNQSLNLLVAGSIDPGDIGIVTIPVILSNDAPSGRLVYNTASIYPGNGGARVKVSETVPPVVNKQTKGPVLTGQKMADVTTVIGGGMFTYTLVLTNSGQSPTANPFIITDSLPPYTNLNGSPKSSVGTITNHGDLTHLVLSVAATIQPGESISISIPVLVSEAAPFGRLDKNTAVVFPGNGGGESNVVEKSPPCVEDVPPVITAQKHADTASVYPGDSFHYSLTLTNSGGVTSNPFTVADQLPAGVTLSGTPTSSVGAVTNTGDSSLLSLSIAGAIESGQSATITLPVTLSPAAALGTLGANSAYITPGNNGAALTVTEPSPPSIVPRPTPILSAIKESDTATRFPGGSFNYILTIHNSGEVPTSFPFLITDDLPADVSLSGVPTSDVGIVTNSGNTTQLVLTISGSIAAGGTATVRIPVAISTSALPGRLGANTASIAPGSGGSVLDITEADPPQVISPTPLITAIKSASVTSLAPGGGFNYVLTISNSGGQATTNPFLVTDSLPTNVTLSGTPTSSAGAVYNSGSNTELILSIVGSIPPGGTATVTIPVVVSSAAPMGQLGVNTAMIVPGNNGSPASASDTHPPTIATTDVPILRAFKQIFDAPSAEPTAIGFAALNHQMQIFGSPVVSNDLPWDSLMPPGPVQPAALAVAAPGSIAPMATAAATTAVAPGASLLYVITVNNIGSAQTTNPFTITDVLPPYLKLRGTPYSSAGTVTNTGSDTNLVLSVPTDIGAIGAANSTIAIAIPVTVDPNAPAGAVADNLATVIPGNGGVAVPSIYNPPSLSIAASPAVSCDYCATCTNKCPMYMMGETTLCLSDPSCDPQTGCTCTQFGCPATSYSPAVSDLCQYSCPGSSITSGDSLLVPSDPTGTYNGVYTPDQLMAAQIIDLVNQYRVQHGLPAYTISQDMMNMAFYKAADMAHDFDNGEAYMCMDGTAFCTNAAMSHLNNAGLYTYQVMEHTGMTFTGDTPGENIATISSGFESACQFMCMWLSDCGHLQNILCNICTTVGVSVVYTHDGGTTNSDTGTSMVYVALETGDQ